MRAPRMQWCRVLLTGLLAALAVLQSDQAPAETVYQDPSRFLQEVFGGDPPRPGVLWITPERREEVEALLDHPWRVLRVRYWRRNHRIAWILEEIGKYEPITTGVVVEKGRVRRLEVLIYRESIGSEVRFPYFTEQFRGARLTPNRGLSPGIDAISGATLSSTALMSVAKLALYLSRQVAGEP